MSYVTVSEVKQAGGYDSLDSYHDALISQLIPRAVTAVETLTNNVFKVDTVTSRSFDYMLNTDGFVLYFDEYLATDEGLIVTNGTGQVISSDNFALLPRNYKPIYALQLKTDTEIVWDYQDSPETAITVTGYWGYSLTPPESIKQVVTQMILHWVKQNDQSEVKPLPDEIYLMLKPFTRITGGL